MSQIIVAGHICLDIIPSMPSSPDLRPGQLVEIGAAEFSTGGCVSNVGLALRKLGSESILVGKLCDDAFGKILLNKLETVSVGSGKSIQVSAEGNTSYTIVISPPGVDRTFLHSPGCNDTFGPEDLDFNRYPAATHFHFGYPPLMARMFGNEGSELESIFRNAKQAGLTTSLDMSLPDSSSPSGQANWDKILTKVLPFVDYFLPSLQELSYMLSSENRDFLMSTCIERGAGTVVLKDGEKGLHVRNSKGDYFEPCFSVDVVGTTGSGDASVAGFLYGTTRDWPIQQCLLAATAVGAFCVEAPDAISGIRPWAETSQRVDAGWRKRNT